MVRVAVLGTGLIGGSILLRLDQAGVDVIGWDPDPDTRAAGRRHGVAYADDLAGAVRGRRIVFLCGPLPSLPATLAAVARTAGDDCVITDVGSTKAGIAGYATAHGLADRFVPGHPMAGTEHAGLRSAIPALFDGAAWVLCPLPGGTIDGFRRLAKLLIDVFGARVVPMSPDAHDSVVALSSHVPHLLAGGLAGAVARSPLRDAIVGLAAGSFRDGTRVAGAPSRRTADMLASNRDAVLRQVESVRAFFDELSADLRDGDVEALRRHYAEGRELRQSLADRPMSTSLRRFPAHRAGPDEREFLVALGEAGGCLTGCAVDAETVTYSIRAPRARPV